MLKEDFKIIESVLTSIQNMCGRGDCRRCPLFSDELGADRCPIALIPDEYESVWGDEPILIRDQYNPTDWDIEEIIYRLRKYKGGTVNE